MIPVTQEFLDVIKHSHQITSVMTFYQWDQPTAGIAEVDYTAKVISGSVTADRQQKARRNFSAEVALHEWEDVPVDIISSRVQIWTGTYAGLSSMMVPVGVFRIDEIGRINAGTLSLSGSSLEEYVIDDQWTAAGKIAKNTPIINKIKEIIADSVPGAVEFDISPDAMARDELLPYDTPYKVGESKWDVVESLAFDIECDVYCDPMGRFRITPRPLMNGPKPVALLHEGPDGVLIALNTQVTRDKMHNGVVVISERSGGSETVTHSGIALDTDPTSPTRWGGPFGKRPMTHQVKSLTSDAQCKAKAEAMLLEYKATTRTLDFSAIPNPALEPDDVVQVSMLDGTYEDHLVTRIQIPFGLGDWMANTLSNKDQSSVTNPDRPIEIPDPTQLAQRHVADHVTSVMP